MMTLEMNVNDNTRLIGELKEEIKELREILENRVCLKDKCALCEEPLEEYEEVNYANMTLCNHCYNTYRNCQDCHQPLTELHLMREGLCKKCIDKYDKAVDEAKYDKPGSYSHIKEEDINCGQN